MCNVLTECAIEAAGFNEIFAVLALGWIRSTGYFFDFCRERTLEFLRRFRLYNIGPAAHRPFRRIISDRLMIRTIIRSLRTALEPERLTDEAIAERDSDLRGLSNDDPGIDRALEAAVAWIATAQDNSATADGGVARDYSLIEEWNASYPETTGYIVPTLIDYAKIKDNADTRVRAKRMLDWLVSIQFPDGGFQGSVIGAEPVIPVTFNTGQILLGLAAGTGEFGDEYREPMRRAANWLVQTQDPDGCWRSHRSPFTEPTDKAYETHVSWGLFEAARIDSNSDYSDAAMANIRWALRLQNANGWFRDCCLSEPEHPLTHTIGYVLRGVIEAFRFSGDETFLDASIRTADALVDVQRPDGDLPGRLDENWTGTVEWTCLTGNVQIAACWLILFKHTGDVRYLDAAAAANKFVRRTLDLNGLPAVRGAVKGSFPVSGGYCTYEYPNWAAKFLIDSLLLEQGILSEG